MSDVEEEKLEQIQDTLDKHEIEEEIKESEEEIKEEIEEVKKDIEECLDDIKEEIEEIHSNPTVIPIPSSSPEIDYDLLAEKVADKLEFRNKPVEEEKEEEPESEPIIDEPPEHNSRLYKKIF